METITLAGGAAMPLVGFGTWKLRGDEAYRAVREALDVGYRHLDTATMYGNEAEVGRALRDSGVPREEVFVTTKLPPEKVGREDATLAASTKALDGVDLWLVHWPPGGAAPEVWRRFVAARDAGHVREIGVSNYDADQIDELTAATGVPPAVNQIRWGPALYDQAIVRAHADRGVVLEGYSPFRTTRLDHPVLVRAAAAHGVQPTQVVLRWHLQHGVVVIPKSAHAERIRTNLDLDGFALTDEEMAAIDAMSPYDGK
jgi:2,5-diketo-D-gluconate reductase A